MLTMIGGRSKKKYPWLPSWVKVQRECDAHPHVPVERAELFEAYNTGTTELEVLNWLHATIMVLKPAAILETGAANGIGTIALASACRNNGCGVVHSVELDPDLCHELEHKVKKLGLAKYVQVHCMESLKFIRQHTGMFDVGYFDSMCEIRASEFEACLDARLIRSLAVFHDTSPTRCQSLKGWPNDDEHIAYRADLRRLAADPRCSGFFESTLSRGFTCIFIAAQEEPQCQHVTDQSALA